MCELFGFSGGTTTRLDAALTLFQACSGHAADNRDGGGIAWREDGASRIGSCGSGQGCRTITVYTNFLTTPACRALSAPGGRPSGSSGPHLLDSDWTTLSGFLHHMQQTVERKHETKETYTFP